MIILLILLILFCFFKQLQIPQIIAVRLQQITHYNINLSMNNSSSNPSDYEFLIRTLTQGNHVARAQSLKRFNSLVLSDKKQFASYAKRIVIALQQLMLDPKEDINLLACTLALQIINFNPRDIQFYVRTKLLKAMVVNLGDAKPQIRKTSHYCLLAYIRTFRNFDDLIEAYSAHGIQSEEWQLRQKAINSFQSILVMEMRYLNWTSLQFRKIFQTLLNKLRDDSGFVQKAAEQCLLSLSKAEDLRAFSKRLTPALFLQLRSFCEQQYEMGHLAQVKLDLDQKQKKDQERHDNLNYSLHQQNSNTVSLINSEKKDFSKGQQGVAPFRMNDDQQQSYPKKPQKQDRQRYSLKKADSVNIVNHLKELKQSQQLIRQIRNPERDDKSLRRQTSLLLPPISMLNPVATSRQQKMQALVGKKLLQDLKNDKDWKVRLQGIQQLQTKFQMYRQEFDIQTLIKNLLPVLIKLLGDANFKVALIALKIIEEMLRTPQIPLEGIVPQIVQKLSDNKVALRQNISKLIKSEYLLTKQGVWLDNLLLQIRKTANSNIKEEILNILARVYEDGAIPYSFQKILETVCPMMDDLKTKIKIKTLDLLALVTIKSQKIDKAKTILATKMNQVYYEMYLQKIGKQLKIFRQLNPSPQRQPTAERDKQKDRNMRSSVNHLSRKINKIGNTTSTSLQRYGQSIQKQQNSTVKTAFYDPIDNNKMDSIVSRGDIDNYQVAPTENVQVSQVAQVDNISDDQAPTRKKHQSKHLRRRGQKSIQSRLSTTNYSSQQGLAPFHDAGKQLKNVMVEIKSQDWQVSNEALIKFRRIIIHHSDILVSSATKAIMPDLMRLTESLRSTLSKNAVIAVNELSMKVKRQLDPQFDLMFSKLIKKTLDTNSFISQEVKRALITICSNCNQTKVVNQLNSTHSSRAIPIKTAITNIIEGIVFLPKVYEKQLEKIVLMLVDFMGEGSLQIRQKTKQLLNAIIASQKGPTIMKLIPPEHRNKLKKRQEPFQSPSKIQPVTQRVIEEKPVLPPVQYVQDNYSKRKKRNKITNFPQQFQQLQNLLQTCQSSDWKIRLENMTRISQICLKYPEQISQHRANSRIIDVLSKQINDPNMKVAGNALKIFEDIVCAIPSVVQTSLSVILNQVFICFSSGKAEIKTLAEQLFDSICEHVQKWMLTQHICNGALYSIQKSKPVIIAKLAKLVPAIYKVKPGIFQKNVYPMINKIAQENKPELNTSLKMLLQAIYTEIGEDCMTFLKQKAKQLVFE